VRSALSVRLSLDDASPIQICNEVSLNIPVHAGLTTDDGFVAEFSTTFSWGPLFENPSGLLQVVPGLYSEGLSDGMSGNCPTILQFDSEGVYGRFCDEQRRLALFPTACGGIAQVDSSQAPYPPLQAPLDYFSPIDGVTLTYEDLPPISVSVALDDPSACYASHERYWIDADLSFETDGVRLEANGVQGYVAPRDVFDDAGQLVPGLGIEFAEYCGDVSMSAAWGRVAADAGAAAGAPLCLTLVYEKLADGTLSYAAEAAFDGASIGWVFLAR
jgi:hypothetical protein